ncbi:hypothetical protein JCGZ_19351 [Jatropha curcas]|uniref:Uncharacterized protein n=1 Tax=Jatropha curcas TaxID=180498 RepID=A0A067KBF1_JATCU|nr:hypothetical protein JCGZ_19351 [Jatropha curcas]
MYDENIENALNSVLREECDDCDDGLITDNINEGQEEGMVFSTLDWLYEFYWRHEKCKGFGVAKKSEIKGVRGPYRYYIIACDKEIAQFEERFWKQTIYVKFSDTDQRSKVKDPLALPVGLITRAHATKLRAALNAFAQEQITLELQDHNYARCEIELKETPKLVMVLKACKEAAC